MTEGAKTLTGIPLDKVMDELNAELDSAAYKAVPHRTYLTDISPAYLREVATRVFGLCGWGWFYNYETDHVDVAAGKGGKEYMVTIKRFWLRFRYVEQDGSIMKSELIPAAGGSHNDYLEDALKGAITNCLGNAFSKLGWQLDVYKGLRSHEPPSPKPPKPKPKKKAAPKKNPPVKKPTDKTFDEWAKHVGPDEIQWLEKSGIIPPKSDPIHIVNLLNLLKIKPGADLKPHLSLFKHYRGNRDVGMSSKMAASAALDAIKA